VGFAAMLPVAALLLVLSAPPIVRDLAALARRLSG
jgi:hypothetical protein